MSTIIQIKRSANVSAPSTTDLLEAELAYSQDKSNDGAGAILYIESKDSTDTEVIHKIGGKYYTDIVDGATNANTANKLVKRDVTGNFSANIITANEFVGNVTGTISGQASSAAIANTANTLTTARVINLGGDLEGNVSFDGSSDVTIVANVKFDSLTLGTDTTGDYVANVLAGTGIAITGQGGETATPTIALTTTGVSAGHYGGATQIPALTIDAEGRITSAANVSVSTAITLGADSGSADTLTNGDTLRVLGGTGIDTTVTDNTITVALETSGVTANTYGGASSIPVFTVDATGRITAAANVAVAGVTNFTASGNTFTISTADGGTFSASIQPNSVELGRDTTGDFVSNVVAGTGIQVSNQGGESAAPTVALTNTGVAAATYGGTSNIPVFTVDQQGRITSASNTSISTDLVIAGDTGSDTVSLGSENLAFVGGTGVSTSVAGNAVTINNDGVLSVATGYGLSVDNATGAITINNTGVTGIISGGHGISVDSATGNVTVTNNGVTGITGTANEIEVSGATGNITIGLPNDVTISHNLTVGGNLNVLGNVTTISTVDLRVDDSLIYLAGNNYSSDVVDIGFIGNYFDGSSQRHAGLFRDASDSGLFKLFNNLQPEPTTGAIDTGNASFTIATLVSNITGGTVSGLTANIAVSDGGTGRGTLTTNAILYGQGTSQVGLATGTAGQVLQLNNSGVPTFAGIDGGTY